MPSPRMPGRFHTPWSAVYKFSIYTSTAVIFFIAISKENMIFRWRLTPLFVLAALLNPSDLPPDANHALDMEDDGIPMEIVNLWLDPIPPVLVIDVPKVHNTPRPRIDASKILHICIGDAPDVNMSSVDATTSTPDPTSSVYTLPVGIEETLGTQLVSVSNKHKFRCRLKAIMDNGLFFWLDILSWLLGPLVRLFLKQSPPTPSFSVQSPRASPRQSGKGRTPRQSKKRGARSRTKRSVVAKDDLCDVLSVLILGGRQVLEVDNPAQAMEPKGTAENNKADQDVPPPRLDWSPSAPSTLDTGTSNLDIVHDKHIAITSEISSVSTPSDVDASHCCRKMDTTSGSLAKDTEKAMTFEERMRRDIPFLCTDDSDSESDDEEMVMNAAIRDWIKSQTPIKSSVKQIQSGMAHLSESGLNQPSSVLTQPVPCDIPSVFTCKTSSADALVGPRVAFGANADNAGVAEEHGLGHGQNLGISEPLLEGAGSRYQDGAPLTADQSLDARGILAGYPKGWWSASLVKETELQTLESGNLDFGFESFEVSELVEHLPETCYPRLMDISIGAIARAEVVGDSTEVATMDIESEGDALEISSMAAIPSLLAVGTVEASSIQPVDSGAFVGSLGPSTQSISLAEEGSSQDEVPHKQTLEDSSTTHDNEQQNVASASLVADNSMDVQDILTQYPEGLWNASVLEVSELKTLESGDLDFGFESFDVSELVGPMPEACYQRLMDMSIGAIERAEVVGDMTEGGTADIESEGAALETSSTTLS